jgi:hypothetical protein
MLIALHKACPIKMQKILFDDNYLGRRVASQINVPR